MNRRSPVIYIAGPLSGKTAAKILANITNADRFAHQLVQRCHALGLTVRVLVPHNNTGIWAITHPGDERAQRELYMQECLDWVPGMDALAYLGDAPGALRELNKATECDVTLFDMRVVSIDTVVAWVAQWHRGMAARQEACAL